MVASELMVLNAAYRVQLKNATRSGCLPGRRWRIRFVSVILGLSKDHFSIGHLRVRDAFDEPRMIDDTNAALEPLSWSRYDRGARVNLGRSAADDDRFGYAVTQSLLVGVGPDEDGADEVEEEAVDNAQNIANESFAHFDWRPVYVDNFELQDALSEGRAGCGFEDDEVGQKDEREDSVDYPGWSAGGLEITAGAQRDDYQDATCAQSKYQGIDDQRECAWSNSNSVHG